MYFRVAFLLVAVQARPQISLEYKPMRPFYHPKPSGSHLGVIVSTGQPWPDSAQGYQNFGQSGDIVNRIKDKEVTTSGPGGFTWPSVPEEPPPGTSSPKPSNQGITLDYKPTRPFYHPNPGNNVGQIIPSGQPIPNEISSPSLVNKIKDTTTSSPINDEQTPFNLGYKPMKPFHHSNPGNTLAPSVPPGKPWPDSPEGYENFDQLGQKPVVTQVQETTPKPLTTQVKTENRLNENTSQPILTTTPGKVEVQTPISLEYKPNKPFHHSSAGNTLTQIIPPGKPWPDSPEGYQNFSQVDNSPSLVVRGKETTTQPSTTTGKSSEKTPVSLEYEPNMPSFHPNPGNTVGEIIPPGKPWPDSPGSQNISQVDSPNLVIRVKETTAQPSRTTVSSKVPEKTPISLEYEPNRPSFHPNPGDTLGEIIPPGKPWPDSPEGYKNFSQVDSPNLGNRGKGTTAPPKLTTASSKVPEKTPISLEYKPNRPSFHPNPGDTLGEIIPPGKPWPDSPEGYQNFSQTSSPNLGQRIRDSTQSPSAVSETTPDLIALLQELVNKRKPQPSTPEVTSELTPAGWVWETKTSSEEVDLSSESSEEDSSEATSTDEDATTTEKATTTTETATEERLYTSSVLKPKSEEKKISGSDKSENQRTARMTPFFIMPFDWVPSHYLFYLR